MNKTKKKGFLKIAGIMAVMMMLATCVVSGTMAKYTSNGSVSGIPSVTPAKWSITVGGEDNDIAQSSSVSLSTLKWTIKQEADVTATPAAEKIAPGTWGYAEIEIKNAGEVDADVTVTISDPTTTSAGLKFKTVALSKAPTAYSEVSDASDTLTNIKLAKSSGTITIYICYEWKYDADGEGTNDENDTNLGKNPAAITFESANLTVTATQAKTAAAGD